MKFVYLFCEQKFFLKKNYLSLISIIIILAISNVFAQKQTNLVDTIYVDSIPKKIIYDKKIYKLNAGFFDVNAGYYFSNIMDNNMNGINAHFNFHTYKDLYMQVGINRIKGFASYYFPERKDVTISYFNLQFSPLVFKTEGLKFAFIFTPIGIAFGGGYKDETYHYEGKISKDSTNIVQNNYFGLNFYSSFQYFYKFKYDLGIGSGIYAEYQYNTMIVGINISLYFSAAFVGNQTKPVWYYKKNPDKKIDE
ncbi:MAG TPA: hypothetical protein PK995_05060 [Bacteroidia bacterium]|nr:hypothetical protein [Bacteroidia bacterium]